MASSAGSGGHVGACATQWLLLLLTGSTVVVVGGGSDAFNMGVILPFDGAEPWSLRLSGPAIDFAVDSVTAAARRRGRGRGRAPAAAAGRVTPVSLRRALRVHVNDSRCSDTWGPLSAFDMYVGGRANVFVGPVCEYAVAAVARYSPHWDIPVITPGALVLDFDNRANYRLLTRIAGSYSKLAESLGALLRRFSWRPSVVGLVYQQRGRRSPSSSSSRSTLGNSDCFFVMQAVHSHLEALRRPPSAGNASSGRAAAAAAVADPIWYHSIKQDGVDAATRLREISRHARSKSV